MYGNELEKRISDRYANVMAPEVIDEHTLTLAGRTADVFSLAAVHSEMIVKLETSPLRTC